MLVILIPVSQISSQIWPNSKK